jgi:NAD(P)-dependent dehydrogenase (short-subunit alcohol dehydrogenase family)
MRKLENRVAVVTGGGRGIGRAIALAFAREGAKVAVTARSTDELNEVVSSIQKEGGEAAAISADLADRAVPEQLVEQVKSRYGPADILVNNAGVGSSANPKQFVDFDDDFWDLSMAVNLTAPYLLTKAALPDMLERGSGRVIMVSSINGKIGCVHGCAYAASKHGLLGLMRTLAMELGGTGVTTNAICPGPVRTVMNDKRVQYDAERRGVSFEDQEASMTAIGRRLDPDEIAPMAVFLASDDSSGVTGQAYNIDGGILMTG